MSRVLVAYASKHGSTAEIAAAVTERIEAAGHDVDCTTAAEVGDLSGYEAVVLGSAVYAKRWMRPARRLLASRAGELGERALWLFSSGPCGKDPDPSWAEPKSVRAAAERLGARDHAIFGGRLPLEPGNFIEKAMVRDTPPEQRDLRDWDEIGAWADSIGTALRARVGVER
jgi:menaquinone-dependent protoporphyrinogen oxidase